MINQQKLVDALKSWASTEEIGRHELAHLDVVEESRREHGFSDKPTGYGMAFKDVLQGVIESLKPDSERSELETPDKSWRPYVILTERYVQHRSPASVADELGISRDWYNQEQRRALSLLAARLQELEELAQITSRSDRVETPPDSESEATPAGERLKEQQETDSEEFEPEQSARDREATRVVEGTRSEPLHRPRWLLVVALSSVALAMLILAGFLLRIRDIAPKSSPTAVALTRQPITTPLPTSPVSVQVSVLCNENDRMVAPAIPRFLRNQGVSVFTVENTTGSILTNRVRSLAIDSRGLWIGYFATIQSPASGLGQYDKKSWAKCSQLTGEDLQNINALATDSRGKLWIGMEKSGILSYDGKSWRRYTTRDGLPSDEIFGLTVDGNGEVWAGTWEGVARFDGNSWSVPYTVQKQAMLSNRVHAIAVDGVGNTWIGHLGEGISLYRKIDGKWAQLTTQNSGLGGNHIRGIVVRKADLGAAESLWFATHDGGVSKLEQGEWTVYRTSNGFISDDVRAIAIDKYNRVWAATDKGVVYSDGSKWIVYNTLDTLSIAFGSNCLDCPFDDEHVWTGTAGTGLTHSRLPYLDNETAVQVRGICLENAARERFCQSVDDRQLASVITSTYPTPLAPGDTLRMEIILSPRAPYQLREDRGDFLSNTAETDEQLSGVWAHIAVKGVIEPNQSFKFTDYENLLKVPRLAEGETEKVFSSTWRVWMHTRYVGPYVRIVYIARKSQ